MSASLTTTRVDESRENRRRPAPTRRKKASPIPRALVLPAFAVAVILTQLPFLVTIYYSFQDWNLLRPNDVGFAGFDNYIGLFSGSDFFQSLFASVLITGSSVIISVIFGLGFALLLDRKFHGQGFARTLLITPFLMMPAAAALIWKWSLFDANSGIFNWVLSLVGIDPVAWNTDFPVLTIIAVLSWQYTPFMMLILLAGLQSQSAEVVEAAQVDGAGPWRIFRSFTLPHLRQYLELSALLGTIFMLQVFDPVHIMTKGTGGTKTLPYLLYERAFIGLNVGQAAAYGVITVILTIIVATIALRTMFRIFSVEGNK